MADLIDTTEMYLRTILELEEEGQPPMRARISERLHHSGPTVSQTVSRMERDGLLVVAGDRHIELSVEGRLQAVRVMRKHRLAERLLADVIGLEWEFVHEEACRWEHVMSEQVERKILDLIERSDVSPYGNPIPGLEELGVMPNPAFGVGVSPLTSVIAAEGSASGLTLARIAETIQIDPEFLANLAELGILPGAKIMAEHSGSRILITAENNVEGIALDHDLAVHLFVER
ncbi:MAG: metal-dependent transcriptional regulator [Rhodoluna sp.]|nr:metal-dependent transcriptional regulator [Rhodoluna sp.]